MIRPKLQAHLSDRDWTLPARSSHYGAKVAGRGGHLAVDPMFKLAAHPLALALPLVHRGDWNVARAVVQHKRIGQPGNRGHGVEIRRELAGAPDLVLPIFVEGADAASQLGS